MKNNFETMSDMSLSFSFKPAILALTLGLSAMILTLMIGYFTYVNSISSAEHHYHDHYMNQALNLALTTSFFKDKSDSELIELINKIWRNSGKKLSE